MSKKIYVSAFLAYLFLLDIGQELPDDSDTYHNRNAQLSMEMIRQMQLHANHSMQSPHISTMDLFSFDNQCHDQVNHLLPQFHQLNEPNSALNSRSHSAHQPLNAASILPYSTLNEGDADLPLPSFQELFGPMLISYAHHEAALPVAYSVPKAASTSKGVGGANKKRRTNGRTVSREGVMHSYVGDSMDGGGGMKQGQPVLVQPSADEDDDHYDANCNDESTGYYLLYSYCCMLFY